MALIDRYRRLREEMDAESISKKLSAIEDRLWYGPPGSAECSILAEELYEARQRGAEERARDSLAPPDLLILCVGYSPEPLLLAVAYHAPAHVALLVEMHLEQGYLRSLERLWDSFHDVLGVSSFAQLDRRTTQDSAAGVFLLVREIAERWRARSQGRVVLDISGAKKSMIAGAFLAGGLLDLDASYVDFDDYDALLRRPLPGTSRPGRLEHPYRLFKLREEARLHEEFDRRRFHEAEKLAATLRDLVRDPDVANVLAREEASALERRYETVRRVSHAYALWSDGFYQEARNELAAVPGIGVPATVEFLAPRWPTSAMADKEIVKALSAANVFADPATALAYFLDVVVWNAESRIEEHPRDCYLRLYGTIESAIGYAFHVFVNRRPERLQVETQGPTENDLRGLAIEACETSVERALKVLSGRKLALGRLDSGVPPFTVSLPAAVISEELFASLFEGKGEGDHLRKFTDLRHKAVHWLAPVPQSTACRLLVHYRKVLQELVPLVVAHLREDAAEYDAAARQRLDEWEGWLLAAAKGEIPEDCEPMPYSAVERLAASG